MGQKALSETDGKFQGNESAETSEQSQSSSGQMNDLAAQVRALELEIQDSPLVKDSIATLCCSLGI
jgi:hypothetical protein